MDNEAQNALTQRLAQAEHLAKRLVNLQSIMERLAGLLESGLPPELPHYSGASFAQRPRCWADTVGYNALHRQG